MPDRARRKAIWRPIGSPGVVLVDGEIRGIWRARATSRDTLAVSVEPFEPLSVRTRDELEAEAQRLARARERTGATVGYAG
ncbi:hypothetical protein N505_0115880 [Rhodococcus aetherivorans]|nr:crosslink repair DNA glycosylase YcaQ family protein [Rhodococcus aetherivorans]KDE12296.1 hypothetical protein N505_0115880 [Rhodococcus aetherivorans]